MRKLALLLAVTLIAGCSAGVPTGPKKTPDAVRKDGGSDCQPEYGYPYIYPCTDAYGHSGFTLSSG